MSGCSGGWEGWEKLRERERGVGELNFLGVKPQYNVLSSFFFFFF
jgi:hypothetical protein